MEERVKHRIVGLAVIISIGVIFAPAIIKKSNQRLVDKTKTATFHLPKRPLPPKVTVKEEQEVFKAVKVAHVSLDKPVEHAVQTIAKAKPIRLPAASVHEDKTITVAKTKQVHTRYAVQLASFSKINNANNLVNALKGKGFNAHYEKITTKTGRLIYKVMVGDVAKKESANKLKQKLAQSIKLNGIIVSQRVS